MRVAPDDVVDDDGVGLLQQFVKSVGNVAELHALALEYLNVHTPTIYSTV